MYCYGIFTGLQIKCVIKYSLYYVSAKTYVVGILKIMTHWASPQKNIKKEILIILSITFHINCIIARFPINVGYLMACVFIRPWKCCTFWMTLNDVTNEAESTFFFISLSLLLVWRENHWENWLIEYQVCIFWYQNYQAWLRENMLNRKARQALRFNKHSGSLAW